MKKLRPFTLALAALVLFALPAAAGPWGRLTAGKRTWELSERSIVIGTGKRADVRVQHPTVAERHARITNRGGVVMVEDLGSRFGTLVAGTELKKGKPMQLFQKTILSLGALNLTFEWGDRGKLIKPLRKSKEQLEKEAAEAAAHKKKTHKRRARRHHRARRGAGRAGKHHGR